ncbi:MAG: hypothetical protein U5K31_02725 [Balneolaceae bacterium]|nr:hypothetical protein [Balneolaceae bacterium]
MMIPDPAPRISDWWYYGTEHGQHIGFYRLTTLKYLARRFEKYLASDGISCHLLSSQPFLRRFGTGRFA